MKFDAVLGPDELVPGRPFTDPGNTTREARVMREMLEREQELATGWMRAGDRDARVEVAREGEQEERRHLLVVPDPGALLEARNLTAVGFFGRPRADVDHTILFDLEHELVDRMGFYAELGLLSYYDVELVKGAYGNLVLFSTPDVPAEWYRDSVHRRAVEISPHHYYEVRLHKGSIRGRLTDDGDIVIERTKYFDFAGAAPWQAVRRFSAG
jgi:hypothetical protein